MEHKINTSELKTLAKTIHAGDRVLLSGVVYTARDAAHKRMIALLDSGEPIPIPIDGAAVPTPAPNGLPIGSCGPTTSGRMDPFAPRLLDLGLCCMIGKGERNNAVCDAIRRNGAVYLCAVGGAGALACKCITSCEVIAFDDLGCESIKKLEFKDFPLIAAIDCHGGNLFKK